MVFITRETYVVMVVGQTNTAKLMHPIAYRMQLCKQRNLPLTACVCAPGKTRSPTGAETSSPSEIHPWRFVYINKWQVLRQKSCAYHVI